VIKIAIPTALRKYCQELAVIEVQAATVGDALQALVVAHPALKAHLMDASGKLRSFVNVYLGEEDVRNLDREATALKAGDEILIIPAIAGGMR
jgi:molybdopterin synthase sulfur carrier subunit